MNKYTELSDAEINVKVFINLYGKESLKDKDMRRYFSRVDYCNNPADAMPIIIENKICTAFDVFAEEHDGGNWVASPAYGFASERTRSNNLYRAAMELFLLMKYAENEKV